MMTKESFIPETTNEYKKQIHQLKEEIEALKVHVKETEKTWYKQVPTIVAILALLFSFGTTFVSYYRTAQLDKQASQVELRTLLQRIVALPKENFELFQKYKDYPLENNQLSGFINNENLVLSRQAASISATIPEIVTGAEYYAIGQSLVFSGIIDKGIEFFKKAALQSDNPTSAVAAYRSLGAAAYTIGKFEEGNKAWEQSLKIFDVKYPNEPEAIRNYTHVLTLTRWAQSEIFVNKCDSAKEHLNKAHEYYTLLPTTFNNVDTILGEIQQTESFLASCASK